MTRLLLISNDVVDTHMAGSGLRYWEMARALAGKLDVTLATPDHSLPGEGFTTCIYERKEWRSIEPTVSQAQVLLFDGNLFEVFPELITCGKPLILEAANTYSFETIHQFLDQPPEVQIDSFSTKLEITRQVGLAGDFFFCANERQRDYWLGVLNALGRINPGTYKADQTLRQLIDIVPFGLPPGKPEHTEPVMKGVIPGISATDQVMLWGGGLWQWLDPLSLVRAVARVSVDHPDLRLVFPGTRHPNPIIAEMPMLRQTRDLSDRLGLTGRVTFFGDWAPYQLWPSFLLEADIGASMHLDTLETHFAFRTRMLDYIWAGLPMVVTGGDVTSSLVAEHNLGKVVPPGDELAIAAAIVRLLETPNLREAYRERFEKVRPDLAWERMCEPITRFCEQPRFAADHEASAGAGQNAPEEPGASGAGWQSAYGNALAMRGQRERREQQAEIERLRALVRGYEEGRFIRLMQQMAHLRGKLGV
jgi:glycosyltransferase involved in cell wall biosynthesis